MWIDVTWGAGGSTADTTLSLCETAMDVTGLDVLMHLTCTNVTIDTTRQVLQRCKDKGLCNILALRGDPPATTSASVSPPTLRGTSTRSLSTRTCGITKRRS